MNGIREFWEGAGLDISDDDGEVKGEFMRRRAGLAQLAELAGAMQKTGGSNPSRPTIDALPGPQRRGTRATQFQ